MSPRVVILIALGALAGAGCRSAPACPTHIQTDSAAALDAVSVRQRNWSSLKAEARVTQWADRGRIRGNVLMFFERPSRVRFDVMTQFGPAAVLTSDGRNFQLSDLRANTFVQGPTCPSNIARLLGVAIDGQDVIRLLTGDTPRIEGDARTMECRRGVYVATLRAADGTTQEIELVPDPEDVDPAAATPRLLLKSSTLLGPDGAVAWRATYSDYRVVEGISLPTNVRLTDYANGADTEVRVKSLTVNPTVPGSAFNQVPRPGASIEIAACP